MDGWKDRDMQKSAKPKSIHRTNIELVYAANSATNPNARVFHGISIIKMTKQNTFPYVAVGSHSLLVALPTLYTTLLLWCKFRVEIQNTGMTEWGRLVNKRSVCYGLSIKETSNDKE